MARAVAARVLAKNGSAWWIPAADAVSVTQHLLGLAEELGASRGQVEEALAGRLNPSDVLWQQLENTAGWMLVLDNADNPAALTAGDRPVNSGSGWLRSTRTGLMLVTSRVADPQRWGPIARIVPLESLGEADGAQVLLDLAPGAGDRGEAESLCGQLGGLPLALHQPPVFSVTWELWADVFRGAVSWCFAAGCLVAGCGGVHLPGAAPWPAGARAGFVFR